jgi:nicotinamidase-related amidase
MVAIIGGEHRRFRPLIDPLTSENAALVLIDHQVSLMTGVRDYSTGELKHNVVALGKAAEALKLPIIVTTTARDSMWGPTFPELVEALPGIEIIDRSTVNASTTRAWLVPSRRPAVKSLFSPASLSKSAQLFRPSQSSGKDWMLT